MTLESGLRKHPVQGIETRRDRLKMGTHASTYAESFQAGKKLGLNHKKLGMWLFLGSEVMFFGGLISTFLHYKINVPAPAESALLDVFLVGVNTFILLTSSFVVAMGFGAIERGNSKAFAGLLGLTVLLGLAFLGGQAYEFFSLYQEGLTLGSSVFGSGFYTLTGFHGLHVFIGIIWGLYTLAGALRGKYSAADHDGAQMYGLYWHFVDIVWIVLFTIIYLI
jgi:heme/copper-type cytochrome/quinol oxidase subunit 3